MNYSEKELQKIQDELMSGIDKEVKTEEEILRTSEEIAEYLVNKNQISVEVNNSPFKFAYRVLGTNAQNRSIIVLATDLRKYEIVPDKYQPWQAHAMCDPRVTMKENLRGIIEALIRKITGNPLVEELGAEEAYEVHKHE